MTTNEQVVAIQAISNELSSGRKVAFAIKDGRFELRDGSFGVIFVSPAGHVSASRSTRDSVAKRAFRAAAATR